ncbi:DUF1501 domain-containing protein [Humisphaera borealis]|uniref:DUF1501 domain-containing protein n=1 Tax=Humisphaera borealis TaxID=2807512 RepID=A0A7M2WVZ7_9BACT|nr:DUF1501 domain-containing protein [Humisphaera borealis]QOV89727.1 DUF1501 domain-containing protein [Humisphaera borealis]
MPAPLFSAKLSRRAFIAASTVGFAGLRFGTSASGASGAAPSPARKKPAKSTIVFFLCGGASHIDMWDMKPDAPAEYRGEFDPTRTSAPEIQLCEHLPLLAKQAHHLAVVNGVTDGGQATGDHHAGYYYNLTGHAPDETFKQQGNDRRPYPTDWPYMGCVVGSKRPAHPKLPKVITLPHKPSKLPYTRPGQFAGRLGMEHDPFYLSGSMETPLQFSAPALTLDASITPARMTDRQALLNTLDGLRRGIDTDASVRNHLIQHEKAFSLLSSSSTTRAFDVASEPAEVCERYGKTINGTSMLMARRLVEAGVPFVTVFWKENEAIASKCKSAGGWDTHANNFNCLKDYLLGEFDRALSALIEDLAQKGLLDDTLVLVTSEMGRKPKIGDPRSGGKSGAGRDHWTACMSVLMAGGGVRGGQVYGRTDAHGEYPAEMPISPADVTKTVYHAMGIDDLTAYDMQGRPYNLLDDGRPLLQLF